MYQIYPLALRQFLQKLVGCDYLVTVTDSIWLLWGLRPAPSSQKLQ